jgi:transcriptional regulator with XRE-family HTH domain
MVIKARDRALGAELRELREAAGLRLTDVERNLRINKSTLSNMERGRRRVTPDEAGILLGHYGAQEPDRSRLLEIARSADQPTWHGRNPSPGIPAALSALIDFERAARRITDVTTTLIPGLLQTEDYAREVFRGAGIPADDIPGLVAVRRGRQRILDGPRPVDLRVILDEAALMRGPATIMADQLGALLNCGRQENVTIQVLPFAAGMTPAVAGGYVLHEFDPLAGDPIVHLENRVASTFLDERADVRDYMEVTDTLLTQAMSPADSARLIENRRRALTDGDNGCG